MLCSKHGEPLWERLNDRSKIVRYCLHCEAETEFEKIKHMQDKADNDSTSCFGCIVGLIGVYFWIAVIISAFGLDLETTAVIALLVEVALVAWWYSSSKETTRPSFELYLDKKRKEAERQRAEVDRFLSEHRRRWRHITSGITDLDRMSGRQFEYFMRGFFERAGYTVRITKRTGDQGADLILYKDNERIAVQCKRYALNSRVSVSAIQEVYAARAIYDCHSAMVVTTSYFTEPARRTAERLGVVIWDRDRLIEELAKVQQRISWDDYKATLYENG